MISKVIYVYQISNSGPDFPLLTSNPTKVYFNLPIANQEIKYLPSRDLEAPPNTFYLVSPPSVGGDRPPEDQPNLPLPATAQLPSIIDRIFRLDPLVQIFIETEVELPTPLGITPHHTRTFPDFLATIRSRPEIEVSPSEGHQPLIPWRYRLPETKDWIEMDALGVKGLGFLKELKIYLTEANKARETDKAKEGT